MSLRQSFSDELKAAMRAHDAPRTSTLRMVMARLKDIEIAARTRPAPEITEAEITSMLRGMVKQRRESVALYLQGGRPELADKELAEIGVIEGFLPVQLDDDVLSSAVDAVISETGSTTPKDIGRVMAGLKAKFGTELDMARANPIVRARLNA